MPDEFDNITQKPRLPAARILPDDFVYVVRAGGDFHARGSDILSTMVATCVSLQLGITSLTELREYVTLGVPRPHLIAVNIDGDSRLWLVRDGNGTDNGTWRIRPDDYAATTNEVEIVRYL
jgi:hypothetical protein